MNRKPRTTFRQREFFINFAEKNKEVLNPNSKKYSQLWDIVTKELNKLGPQSCKYDWQLSFKNWEYQLKSKRKQEIIQSGGGEFKTKMTKFQNRVLDILGHGTISENLNVPEVCNNPSIIQEVNTNNSSIRQPIPISVTLNTSTNTNQIVSDDPVNPVSHIDSTLSRTEATTTKEEQRKEETQKVLQKLVQTNKCTKNLMTDYSRKRKKHRHQSFLSSKKLYSAAYELLQKKQQSNQNPENCNLKSFGEYIDTELRKLDKTTCAIVKMKIQEIICQATLKTYKKYEIEIEDQIRNDKDDEEDWDFQISSVSNTEEQLIGNKEIKLPKPIVLPEQQESQSTIITQEKKTMREEEGNPKSKDIMLAIYNVLKTDTKQNIEKTITFGEYIESELKLLDNLTVINVKLKISQILCDAVIESNKKTSSTIQFNIHNAENCQEKRLKEEIIDKNLDL